MGIKRSVRIIFTLVFTFVLFAIIGYVIENLFQKDLYFPIGVSYVFFVIILFNSLRKKYKA